MYNRMDFPAMRLQGQGLAPRPSTNDPLSARNSSSRNFQKLEFHGLTIEANPKPLCMKSTVSGIRNPPKTTRSAKGSITLPDDRTFRRTGLTVGKVAGTETKPFVYDFYK